MTTVRWGYASAKNGNTNLVLTCIDEKELRKMVQEFKSANVTTFVSVKDFTDRGVLLTFSTLTVVFPNKTNLKKQIADFCDSENDAD